MGKKIWLVTLAISLMGVGLVGCTGGEWGAFAGVVGLSESLDLIVQNAAQKKTELEATLNTQLSSLEALLADNEALIAKLEAETDEAERQRLQT